MTLALESTLELDHGGPIPRLGLGVFRAGAKDQTVRAVLAALEVGYRHIDTAAIYRNEAEVGEAIRASSIPREQIFVTTKLWRDRTGKAEARRALQSSLEALGLAYVDLYLMHWPMAERRLEAWRAMEEAVGRGECRAIGVSNFTERHLGDLLREARIRPALNQIELHPFWQRSETVVFCRNEGIAVEAWGPLVKGQKMDDPTLASIAREVGRTPAQVLIRWSLQRGFVVIPKSSRPERIRENAAVFDFTLSARHTGLLDGLDAGHRSAPGWDPTAAP